MSLEYYRRFYSNLAPDNILARVVRSPLDHERDSPASFVKGDIHGCAPFMYQSVGHRPTPDLGQYTVPGVAGLYLVGPFMHPGGGVFGAGRGTAIRLMDDLANRLRQGHERSGAMIIYDGQNKELMTVRKFERDGNDLVVMGKIFGAMPVKARLKPEEARAALKLLTPGLIWFLVTLPFRKKSL